MNASADADPAPAFADLGCGDVHLWLSHPAELREPEAVRACRELLSPPELEKGGRFHFERDRHRFLVTRALVRLVLSRYACVRPQDWEFGSNRFGRPFISNSAPIRRLQFNLSHTSDLVVLAVATGRRIGVDVERLDRVQSSIDIADRFFAASEAADIAGLPPGARERRFLEYWTLKESYIKARGRGLSLPLDSFSFDLSASSIRFRTSPHQDRSAETWRFVQLRASSEHVAALCVDMPPGVGLSLTVQELVPFGREGPIALEVLRTSNGGGGLPAAASKFSL